MIPDFDDFIKAITEIPKGATTPQQFLDDAESQRKIWAGHGRIYLSGRTMPGNVEVKFSRILDPDEWGAIPRLPHWPTHATQRGRRRPGFWTRRAKRSAKR